MKSTPVIVDTNVVVAGLLTASEGSPVVRILDGMLSAAFPFVVSEVLLLEYRSVLLRPAIRRRHGMTVDEIDSMLTSLVHPAIVLQPAPGAVAPDARDQLLWDILNADQRLYLVTGDRVLLNDDSMRGRVLSAAEFVAAWA